MYAPGHTAVNTAALAGQASLPGCPGLSPGGAGRGRRASSVFVRLRQALLLLLVLGALLVCLGGCLDSRPEEADDLAEARKSMMNRDFLDAEKSFERYLRRSPDGTERWEVWNSLVELALSVRNDRKAAIELMEAMLVEYADDIGKKRAISMRLAEQYRLSRGNERALALWSSVAEDPKADPVDRARACRNLAHVYLRRLEFEMSKESLGYCLALAIPDAVRGECLYDLAQTYMGMDEMENAIAELRNVLALQNVAVPTRTLATFMLADALEQTGNAREAATLFASIVESYPNRKVVEQRLDALTKKPKAPPPASSQVEPPQRSGGRRAARDANQNR